MDPAEILKFLAPRTDHFSLTWTLLLDSSTFRVSLQPPPSSLRQAGRLIAPENLRKLHCIVKTDFDLAILADRLDERRRRILIVAKDE